MKLEPRLLSYSLDWYNITNTNCTFAKDCYLKRNIDRETSQFVSWKIGLNLITRSEIKDGKKFNWIVKARFDMFWLLPLGHFKTFSVKKVTCSKYNSDIFLVIPRVYSDHILSISDFYFNCNNNFYSRVSEWIESSKTPFEPRSLPFVVRRDLEAPDICNMCKVSGATDFMKREICVSKAYNLSEYASKKICT